MEKFIVISLHLGGLKNRRFKSGDIVSQSDFSEPLVNLVEKKYLKPLIGEDEKATVEPVVEPVVPLPLPLESEMTKAEIVERLQKIPGITFVESWKKAALYALLVDFS